MLLLEVLQPSIQLAVAASRLANAQQLKREKNQFASVNVLYVMKRDADNSFFYLDTSIAIAAIIRGIAKTILKTF